MVNVCLPVFPLSTHDAQGSFVVTTEEPHLSDGFVAGDTELPHDVHADSERAVEHLSVDRINPGLDELVSVDSSHCPAQNLEMGKML